MRRRLADQDRAGRRQLLGASRVGIGDVVLQDLRPAGRRDPFCVDDVLEADRDAVQRPVRTAGHDRPLGLASLGKRPLLGQMDKGMQAVVQRPDPVETGTG
jgi:hypothetical protein